MWVQTGGTAAASELFRPDLVALRRRMLGLSQGDLAAELGISQGTLSKIEQGLDAIVEDGGIEEPDPAPPDPTPAQPRRATPMLG